MQRIEGDALRGHLENLILAVLERGDGHGQGQGQGKGKGKGHGKD